ncbi:hypothetical protein AVEN_169560-1 [Araneus ventricosus]|uniref:Uncharacterized protein n=1 Tax=Araneus ventricosus TaxID=182803 RepID=A0A4Y2MX94_ARAVE|nr:hypothetical protein AVEN_169560-1 [Araneus ventricosus]
MRGGVAVAEQNVDLLENVVYVLLPLKTHRVCLFLDTSPWEMCGGEDVVKVVVIGGSPLKNQLYPSILPTPRTRSERDIPTTVLDVYICEFKVNGTCKRQLYLKFLAMLAFFHEQRPPHYEDAKVIVGCTPADDPLSLELLTDKWLP